MPFSEFLKSTIGKILIALPTLALMILYWIALAGALLHDKNSGMINETYRWPLLIQALTWFAFVILAGSYVEQNKRADLKPPEKTMKMLGYTILAISIVGFILAELFSGMFFGRWGMLR